VIPVALGEERREFSGKRAGKKGKGSPKLKLKKTGIKIV